jgi:hypothetical protein
MTKTIKKIWVDDDVWNQFQMLFPRQASALMEEWMVMMINQKVGQVSDDSEMQELLHEAEQKKKAIQELSGNLQNVHAKIQQSQIQKRKETLEQKKTQRERLVRAKATNDGIRASGILGRIDIG